MLGICIYYIIHFVVRQYVLCFYSAIIECGIVKSKKKLSKFAKKESDAMKFGETLKELLCFHDLTQKELAGSLDLSPSALGNYIRGEREPDYGTLVRIAEYFQVTTDFLLGYSCESGFSHDEKLLLHIFRSLTKDQQEFYLEQGHIFIRQNKKRGLIQPHSSKEKINAS